MKVDKPKFYRLFELLLKDEIASLPAGSEVTFPPRPNRQRRRSGPEIQIEISDNGPGLPKEALRLVFDPFVVRSDSPDGIRHSSDGLLFHRPPSWRADRGPQRRTATEPSSHLRLPMNPSQAIPSGLAEKRYEFLQKVLLNDSLWEKLIAS